MTLNRDKIIEKLRKFFKNKEEIEFAYLFGSIAKEEISKFSDIDIAVMYKKSCNILKLMSEISKVLKFDEVDIVDLKKSKNLRLIKDIIKDGIVLKDSPKRWDWEINRYHLALDFMNHTKVVYGY